jgi:two-component system KDP operon response regulator KdpE
VTTPRSGSAVRILAVDDDPINRALIIAILARAEDPAIRDSVVLEAASLAEARLVLAIEAIDLLLLDVHLPDGLGLELAAEIGAGPRDRPAIVVLTASVLPADQQAALDAGCDAFLAKPYPAAELVSILSRLVLERTEFR